MAFIVEQKRTLNVVSNENKPSISCQPTMKFTNAIYSRYRKNKYFLTRIGARMLKEDD